MDKIVMCYYTNIAYIGKYLVVIIAHIENKPSLKSKTFRKEEKLHQLLWKICTNLFYKPTNWIYGWRSNIAIKKKSIVREAFICDKCIQWRRL